MLMNRRSEAGKRLLPAPPRQHGHSRDGAMNSGPGWCLFVGKIVELRTGCSVHQFFCYLRTTKWWMKLLLIGDLSHGLWLWPLTLDGFGITPSVLGYIPSLWDIVVNEINLVQMSLACYVAAWFTGTSLWRGTWDFAYSVFTMPTRVISTLSTCLFGHGESAGMGSVRLALCTSDKRNGVCVLNHIHLAHSLHTYEVSIPVYTYVSFSSLNTGAS